MDKIFTTGLVVGSIVVLSLSTLAAADKNLKDLNYALVMASALTVAFAALQYALDFRDKANQNRGAGAVCASIRRDADCLMASRDGDEVHSECAKAILQRLNDFSTSAPLISGSVWRRYKQSP